MFITIVMTSRNNVRSKDVVAEQCHVFVEDTTGTNARGVTSSIRVKTISGVISGRVRMEVDKEELVLNIGSKTLKVVMQNYMHSSLRTFKSVAKYLTPGVFHKNENIPANVSRIESESAIEDIGGVVNVRNMGRYRVTRWADDSLILTNYLQISKPLLQNMETLPNILEDAVYTDYLREDIDHAKAKLAELDAMKLHDMIPQTSNTEQADQVTDLDNIDRKFSVNPRNLRMKVRARNFITVLIQRLRKSNKIHAGKRSVGTQTQHLESTNRSPII